MAFVTLQMGNEPTDALKNELRDWVAKEIGVAREAGRHPLHRCAAEDPQRQDHAPPAAGTGGRRRGQRRRDDARGSRRAGETAAGRGIRARTCSSSSVTRCLRSSISWPSGSGSVPCSRTPSRLRSVTTRPEYRPPWSGPEPGDHHRARADLDVIADANTCPAPSRPCRPPRYCRSWDAACPSRCPCRPASRPDRAAHRRRSPWFRRSPRPCRDR